MGLFFLSDFHGIFRRNPYRTLAFFWIVGLVFGMITGSLAADSISQHFVPACISAVSPIGFLAAAISPLVVSVLTVYLLGLWSLYPSVFVTGFFQSFWRIAALLSYSDCGWLIFLLLFFTNAFSAPLLWIWWLRLASQEHTAHWGCFALVFTGCLLLGALDFSVISPFLQDILLH